MSALPQTKKRWREGKKERKPARTAEKKERRIPEHALLLVVIHKDVTAANLLHGKL